MFVHGCRESKEFFRNPLLPDKSLAVGGSSDAPCLVPVLRVLLMSFLALRLLGGDFAVLQVVAWTGMIVTRTAGQGVTAAVVSTFDGQHPCPLCTALDSARSQEQKDTPLPDGLVAKLKLKDVQRTEDVVISCPVAGVLQIAGSLACLVAMPHDRSDAPAVPPPETRLA
jgi:hypothetical protein